MKDFIAWLGEEHLLMLTKFMGLGIIVFTVYVGYLAYLLLWPAPCR